MIGLISVLFCGCLLFFSFNSVVKDVIITRYQRFRQLNKLVETRYKTVWKIVWVSLTIVAKLYWINFLQWVNNTIEYSSNKTIILSYTLKGKLYKIFIQTGRGPARVLLVTDEQHEDVSDEVLPYIGPNQDWHNRELKPSFWNKESLTFELSTGESKTFDRDQTITI